MRSFGERLRENGYQILLSETGFDPDEEQKLIAAHLSRRPDAILLTGIHHNAQARRLLLGAGIPVVEVWDITDTPIDLCVGFSHAEAGRAAAEFLHGLGHRRAATVTANDERAGRRRDAFAARFGALAGAPPIVSDCSGPASIRAGRRALASLLDAGEFDGGAVFCSSDILAHGVVIEAVARGFSVPGDIAVMGFGDQDFARDIEPALTTVRVDRERLGNVAADAVLDRLEARAAPQPVTDLGFEIVRRASA